MTPRVVSSIQHGGIVGNKIFNVSILVYVNNGVARSDHITRAPPFSAVNSD
jgi:hypothetical protein